MIGLLIRLWFVIVTNSACQAGQPVDYYTWVDVHWNYSVAWSLESPVFGDYWLMKADGEYVLFKFAQSIDETIASGASHGECFRKVS